MTNSLTLERHSYSLAIRDLIAGLKDHKRWRRFAIFYIRRSYWRTKLGLLWPALSFALFVFMLSVVWGQLFGRDLNVYLPHFGYGFSCWIFLNAIISGSQQVFISNASVIKEFPLPLSFYAFAKTTQEMTFLMLYLFCLTLVDLFYIHAMSWETLLVFPALIIYFIDAVLISLILGMLTTRFRDVSQVLPNLMRAFFFFTPVLWGIEDRPQLAPLIYSNPLYHAIEIIRAPMSGELPTILNWAVMLGITTTAIIILLLSYKAGTRQLRAWL